MVTRTSSRRWTIADRLLAALWLVVLLAAPGITDRAVAQGLEGDLVARLLAGGHVLMIRHATAPGTGDPEGFRLADCSTQRNLSDSGRDQARAIGSWLRARGILSARVYSSQWCRCMETAELLGLGGVTPLPALNSFFDRPANREPNLAKLRAFLVAQPPRGEPLILVTHQVTITAMTGIFPDSGEGVVLSLGGEGEPETVGRTRFD